MVPKINTGKSTLLPEQIGPVVYKIAQGDRELALAQKLHHDAYLRRGYIDKPHPNNMIIDEYSPHADYIIAIFIKNGDDNDDEAVGEVVGTMRMIKNSLVGFPALNEFSVYPEYIEKLSGIGFDHIVELSALSVKEGYNVAKGLYRYAVIRSDHREDTHWLAVLDEKLFIIYRGRFHFYFEPIGEGRFYMGAITRPYIMDRARQKKLMRRFAPELAEFLYADKVDQDISQIMELI